MHTISVYPKSSPSLEEVRIFIQSLPEGDWVKEGNLSRGVIESEDGRVYLDYDARYRDYFDKYLDPQQRTQLIARLGFAPTIALHLHPSQAYHHSRELAQDICDCLVKKWGGGCSD